MRTNLETALSPQRIRKAQAAARLARSNAARAMLRALGRALNLRARLRAPVRARLSPGARLRLAGDQEPR